MGRESPCHQNWGKGQRFPETARAWVVLWVPLHMAIIMPSKVQVPCLGGDLSMLTRQR